jgi:hypothetical protein
MRSWPLPLQPRFIVFTGVVMITATLIVAVFFSPSIYIAIPLAVCAALTTLGESRAQMGSRNGAQRTSTIIRV